jgi:hypothetical protein
MAIMLGQPVARQHTPLTSAVISTAANSWAQSTVKDRAGLWRRWQTWVATKRAGSMGTDMARFVQAQDRACPNSKLKYAKTLAAMAGRMKKEVPVLRLYISGLRKQGAEIPHRVAPPLSLPSLELLLTQLPPHLQGPALLAWKSASRWGDMRSLTKSSFLQLEPNEIIVRWRNLKTSGLDPYADCHWTVIADPSPTRLLPIINHVRRLGSPDSLFCLVQTGELDRMMAHLELPWRGHSFKRGALNHLFQIVATTQDKDQRELIPLLAKHAHPIRAFPSTTLKYVSNDVNIALALRTQLVTRLL